MELVFNVDGELITNTAREWFWVEKRPFEKVEELLLSCMCGTNIKLEILKQYVEDILKFKRKFTGNTKDNSFKLTIDNSILPKYIKTKNLDKYYLRLKNPDIEKFYKYGFINPKGKFFAVEWCEHAKWASEYIKKHYTIQEQMVNYKYTGADFLVYVKGWILLHNAYQGEAKLEKAKVMTKAQKETLFDYYIYFNRMQDANNLYKEE